jgi:hypothetical protein
MFEGLRHASTSQYVRQRLTFSSGRRAALSNKQLLVTEPQYGVLDSRLSSGPRTRAVSFGD